MATECKFIFGKPKDVIHQLQQTSGFFVLELVFQAVASCGNDQNSEWRLGEVALHCIRAIAESAPCTEVEVMPQVHKTSLALIWISDVSLTSGDISVMCTVHDTCLNIMLKKLCLL
ncbi:hypothetical protein RND81_04G057400 [Saponaria officinalis]|uniref:Uncharacterized protein n=1 Tax=Saponaria officinalis TaxID=3572 RepID=A0AAW1LCT1_SAPOF